MQRGLLVFVQGGGCSGFQYGMMIEENPGESDLVFESNGVKVYVDPISLSYLQAAEVVLQFAFGADIDYAMLQKLYGSNPEETRHSPAKIIGVRTEVIRGDPDPMHVSTSFVERQNLTMRMSMRRFTRLTNGFSKKIENLQHSVSLHYMHYNFAKIHKTLRVTPAMEAGIETRVWNIEEIVGLVDRRAELAA